MIALITLVEETLQVIVAHKAQLKTVAFDWDTTHSSLVINCSTKEFCRYLQTCHHLLLDWVLVQHHQISGDFQSLQMGSAIIEIRISTGAIVIIIRIIVVVVVAPRIIVAIMAATRITEVDVVTTRTTAGIIKVIASQTVIVVHQITVIKDVIARIKELVNVITSASTTSKATTFHRHLPFHLPYRRPFLSLPIILRNSLLENK